MNDFDQLGGYMKTPKELVVALRQYRHNNGEGLVNGYDIHETNKAFAVLKTKLEAAKKCGT